MKNSKGNVAVIAIIIVIVAMTAGVIGWLFAKNTQVVENQPVIQTRQVLQQSEVVTPKPAESSVSTNETKSGRTYLNPEYGFEFEYPKEWGVPVASMSTDGKDIWIQLGCPEVNMGGEGQCPLQLIIHPASTPDKFLAENFAAGSEAAGTVARTTRSRVSYGQINQIKTARFSELSEGVIIGAYTVFFGPRYYVTFSDYNANYQENEVFKKILSSFKYTN